LQKVKKRANFAAAQVHRLLQKLLRLELSPEDYEKILQNRNNVSPENLAKQFAVFNAGKRVRSMEFEHLAEIQTLFLKALEFYRLVRERDSVMAQNLFHFMEKRHLSKAAVVTGGFHAAPFADFFEKRDYRYALVTPKIDSVEGRESYVESILHTGSSAKSLKSTIETAPAFMEKYFKLRKLGLSANDFKWNSTQLAQIAGRNAARHVARAMRSPIHFPRAQKVPSLEI